jgi:hypothetical protein
MAIHIGLAQAPYEPDTRIATRHENRVSQRLNTI